MTGLTGSSSRATGRPAAVVRVRRHPVQSAVADGRLFREPVNQARSVPRTVTCRPPYTVQRHRAVIREEQLNIENEHNSIRISRKLHVLYVYTYTSSVVHTTLVFYRS